MTQYWIVGATVQGEDMTHLFIERGIWFSDAVGVQDLIPKIQAGDRLAIKRMLGAGATEISIKAVGIVEKVTHPDAMAFPLLFVKWLNLVDQNKLVPFGGFGASLHGPYSADSTRIQNIFAI